MTVCICVRARASNTNIDVMLLDVCTCCCLCISAPLRERTSALARSINKRKASQPVWFGYISNNNVSDVYARALCARLMLMMMMMMISLYSVRVAPVRPTVLKPCSAHEHINSLTRARYFTRPPARGAREGGGLPEKCTCFCAKLSTRVARARVVAHNCINGLLYYARTCAPTRRCEGATRLRPALSHVREPRSTAPRECARERFATCNAYSK